MNNAISVHFRALLAGVIVLSAISPAIAGESRFAPDAVRDRVAAALKEARERRERLVSDIETEAAVERAFESGDGKADKGVRGAIGDLQARRDKLDREIAARNSELAQLTETIESVAGDSRNAAQRFKTFRREVQRLSREMAERVEGTLLGLEKPGLARKARAIAERAASDDQQVVVECFRNLLDVYIEIQNDLSRIGVFDAEIARSADGGNVARRKIARIGDMTGFFSDPDGGGFVLRRRTEPADAASAFVGEVRGLTDSDASAINAFVEKPLEPSFVPFDVSDGRGIAVAQTESTYARWFLLGGLLMYPLAIVAVIAAALIAWRSAALLYMAMMSERNSAFVIGAVRRGEFEKARSRIMSIRGPEGRILKASFDHYNSDRGALEDAFNEAMLIAQPSFRRGLSMISLSVAVSPMLGLLGTVTGMISTFNSLVVFGASDPANLAGGISEALITTEAGLFIAIPALMFRGVLGALAESSLSKIESRAMSLIIALRCAEPDTLAPAVTGATGSAGAMDPTEQGFIRRAGQETQ